MIRSAAASVLVVGALCVALSIAGTSAMEQPVRFQIIDLFIDSGVEPLGAYQVELRGDSESLRLVGIEGGAAGTPFDSPPFYDPRALRAGRVIVGAFSVEPDLPAGRVLVARLHVQLQGESPAEFEVDLHAAAAGDGRVIPVAIELQGHGDGS